MEMLETRKDVLNGDAPDPKEDIMVCGGKFTISEFCKKFWVKVIDTPAPAPGDIVRANKKLADLYWEASREKAKAQTRGTKTDISILNTVLANLDNTRKILHTMVWARSLEARIGLE